MHSWATGKIENNRFVASRKSQDSSLKIMILISFDMTLFQIGINSNVFKKKTSKEVMKGQLMTNDNEWPFKDVFARTGDEDYDLPESSSTRKRSTSNKENLGVVTRSRSSSPVPPPKPQSSSKRKRTTSNKENLGVVTRSRSSSPVPPPKKLKCLSTKNRKRYPLTDSQMSMTSEPDSEEDNVPKKTPTSKKVVSKSKPKVVPKPVKKDKKTEINSKKPNSKNQNIPKNEKKGKPPKRGDIDPEGDGDPPVNNGVDSDGDDLGLNLQYLNGQLYLSVAEEDRFKIHQIPVEEVEKSGSLFMKCPAKSVNEDWYGLKFDRKTICRFIHEDISRFGWIRITYDFVKRVKSKALEKYCLNENRDGLRDSEEETLLLAYREDNCWSPTGT